MKTTIGESIEKKYKPDFTQKISLEQQSIRKNKIWTGKELNDGKIDFINCADEDVFGAKIVRIVLIHL